jgi:hypothetical protein
MLNSILINLLTVRDRQEVSMDRQQEIWVNHPESAIKLCVRRHIAEKSSICHYGSTLNR